MITGSLSSRVKAEEVGSQISWVSSEKAEISIAAFHERIWTMNHNGLGPRSCLLSLTAGALTEALSARGS